MVKLKQKCNNVDVNPYHNIFASSPPKFLWAKGQAWKILPHMTSYSKLDSLICMYAYNYLFISIFWQKEVESRALKECKNMIFIIITIAERWLSSFCNDSFDCKSVFLVHSIQSICLRFLFWMCWCKNIFRIQFANIIRFCKSRILSLSIVMNETWCDDLTVSYFKSNKH